jgi:hypothetical protein
VPDSAKETSAKEKENEPQTSRKEREESGERTEGHRRHRHRRFDPTDPETSRLPPGASLRRSENPFDESLPRFHVALSRR